MSVHTYVNGIPGIGGDDSDRVFQSRDKWQYLESGCPEVEACMCD